MKPLIGITCGEIPNTEFTWWPKIDGQSRTFIRAIERAGGVPFLLPIFKDDEPLRRLFDLCDGLLLAGGNDPHPKLYGQEPVAEVVDFDPLRDRSEQRLTAWALTEAKPVFGICRGMELLSIDRGGALFQHLPHDKPGIDHDSSTKAQSLEHLAHQLRIQPGSKLADILQVEHIPVNSHHHQGLARLGEGVVATAWAEDGLVEAIELRDHPFALGVQGHPESLDERTVPEWQRLFRAFVEASGKARSSQPTH